MEGIGPALAMYTDTGGMSHETVILVFSNITIFHHIIAQTCLSLSTVVFSIVMDIQVAF